MIYAPKLVHTCYHLDGWRNNDEVVFAINRAHVQYICWNVWCCYILYTYMQRSYI